MTSRSHSGGQSEMRLARGFGVAGHTVLRLDLNLRPLRRHSPAGKRAQSVGRHEV